MRGALTVDEPAGERWELALDLLSSGSGFVALGSALLLNRDTEGPGADGHIHIGVVANAPQESREEAQSKVDAARASVLEIADGDEQLRSLLSQFGVIWEYVGDSGMAAVKLAGVGGDGCLIWTDE